MTDMTSRPTSRCPDTAPRPTDLTDLAQSALAKLCADLRQKMPAGAETARSVLGDPCAAAMSYALCDDDEAAASAIVADLLRAGLSVEDVCLDHLAPAARHLGDQWERDRLPFSEVTYATARIQALLRRMPASRMIPSCERGTGALFAAVPGEQHTLGVVMAADLLRRNAWDIGLLVGLTHEELLARLARDDRPVIGLSCSGDHSYPALCRLLDALAGVRPDAHILLSGQIVQDAGKLADLRAQVTVVTDIAETEAAMIRIAAMQTAVHAGAAGHQGQRRISTAA